MTFASRTVRPCGQWDWARELEGTDRCGDYLAVDVNHGKMSDARLATKLANHARRGSAGLVRDILTRQKPIGEQLRAVINGSDTDGTSRQRAHSRILDTPGQRRPIINNDVPPTQSADPSAQL